MIRAAPLRQAGAALVGPIVWATHFMIIYASESLNCRSDKATGHDAVVMGTTFIAIVALILHFLWASRRARAVGGTDQTRRFLDRTSLALDALSLVGIGWATFAAMLLGACR